LLISYEYLLMFVLRGHSVGYDSLLLPNKMIKIVKTNLMKEYHIMVEIKMKKKVLSLSDIKKARKKIPNGYSTNDDHPAIIISKKSATIVFKCIQNNDDPKDKEIKTKKK
jgi:hypothetical protein